MEHEIFKYHVHWKHEGQIYMDEVSAASVTEVVDYFNENKRLDVFLLGVELVGPAEGGSGEFTHLPILPFAPIMAHRKWNVDKNAG